MQSSSVIFSTILIINCPVNLSVVFHETFLLSSSKAYSFHYATCTCSSHGKKGFFNCNYLTIIMDPIPKQCNTVHFFFLRSGGVTCIVCLSVFKMEKLLYNSVNGRFERLLLKECHLKRLCLEMFVYMIKNKLVTYLLNFVFSKS